MAFALDALGKDVRIVNADPAPEHYQDFPGMERIEIAGEVERADADAVIVMECSDLTRTGVAGLEREFLINIDHHAGNRMYGALNWHDETAAACGEMVFDLIEALGVPLTEGSRRTSTWRSSPTPGRSITRTSRRGRSTSAGGASRQA